MYDPLYIAPRGPYSKHEGAQSTNRSNDDETSWPSFEANWLS